MNESALMIGLRLIHILGGVFWAGTAWLIASFLIPTQRATGAAGLTFVEELMLRQKLRIYLGLAMILTILSGLAMYARLAIITHGKWASTTPAKVLGLGALCGIVAGAIGGSVGGKTGKRMVEIGSEIKAAGGSPTDSQRAEMESLQNKAANAMRLVAALLVVTVAAMASARYL